MINIKGIINNINKNKLKKECIIIDYNIYNDLLKDIINECNIYKRYITVMGIKIYIYKTIDKKLKLIKYLSKKNDNIIDIFGNRIYIYNTNIFLYK